MSAEKQGQTEAEPLAAPRARVVILDANSFGRGLVVQKSLEDVGTLVNAGADVVVPEIALHELAAHAVEEIASVNLSAITLAGLVAECPTPSREKTAFESIKQALCAAGARIGPHPATSWRDAMLAQTYQHEPASLKSKVKAGAQDALIAELAVREQEFHGSVLVVSGDRELIRYLDQRRISTVKTMQEATGRIAKNISDADLREILTLMWGDKTWQQEFIEAFCLPTQTDPENLTVDLLGISNAYFASGTLTARVALRELLFIPSEGIGPDGEVFGSSHEQILTVTALLDPETYRVRELRGRQFVGFPWAWGPIGGPAAISEYLEIEESAICLPQMEYRVVSGSPPPETGGLERVLIYLGNEHLLTIALHREVNHGYWGEEGSHGDRDVTRLSFSGPVLDGGVSQEALNSPGTLGKMLAERWLREGEKSNEPIPSGFPQ